MWITPLSLGSDGRDNRYSHLSPILAILNGLQRMLRVLVRDALGYVLPGKIVC